MIDRRGFLRLLGLTSLAGMTPGMLEALGDSAGIPVPGEIIDLVPRPLVIPAGAGGIVEPQLWWNEIDQITTKHIVPALADNLFMHSPLMAYLEKNHKRRYYLVEGVTK